MVRARCRLCAEPERPRRRDAGRAAARRKARRRPDRERRAGAGPPPRFRPDPDVVPALRRRASARSGSARSTSASASTRGSSTTSDRSAAERATSSSSARSTGCATAAATALFNRAARRLPIEFWGYDLRGWPPWSRIRAAYRGEAWGLEMYGLLRERPHRRSTGTSPRPRAIREQHAPVRGDRRRLAPAHGCEGSNLAELFEPGREVVTYADADDLVEKARHFLAHEDERRAIAARGPGTNAARPHVRGPDARSSSRFSKEHVP